MEQYKIDFIHFLIKNNALQFGEFTLKSGRVAPFFINTGKFKSGSQIKKLGEFYAAAIKEQYGNEFDAVYGPAYKGIPLAVTASIGLAELGINKGYVFNRKEAKDHGEGGILVGYPVEKETTLVIVDDVITKGTAVRETIETLKTYEPTIKGIVVSVDRQEKGQTDKSAIQELSDSLQIPVVAIVTIDDIVAELHNKPIDGTNYLNDEMLTKINSYREQYGAK